MVASNPEHTLVKFPLSNVTGICDHYRENGYVVIENLLPHERINDFMTQYGLVKRSRAFIYFSQSIHRSIRPKTNEYGFVIESMQDPSRLGLFPNFANAIKRCIHDEAVSDALTALDGHEKHIAWQDMFFDLSVGTIDHADTWYLDTDPPGSLVAAWFALEDIDERAGPFFVMPGSHRAKPLDRNDFADHEQFRQATLKFIADHGFKPRSMTVSRGDVILWHPFTVHGSFANKDRHFSRKSLTSHYYPYGFKRARQDAEKIEPTENPRMYRVKRGNDLLLNANWYAQFIRDGIFGRRARMDMRRTSYSD